MRHLLAAGLRWVRNNEALRQAFCPRHIGAGATSLAIHAFVIGSVVWLSMPVLGIGVGGKATTPKRTASILAIFAPQSSANTSAPGAERPSARPLMQASKDAGPVKEGIKMEPGEATLEFPGFTFDVAKLVARGTALFPFLTRELSFNVEKPREKRKAPLVNPFATQPALSMDTPPLVMTAAEVQRIVDEAWARRERWAPFQRIRALADTHHPDTGQVPALLRGHVEQNALQPYVDGKTRDPRVWTQLALAADHELFIDYIADYVSRHPGTKASIELLFLLDVLAQGSLDTLTLFLEIEPDRDLKWTRGVNPAAFRAIVKIRDYYIMQRERRGLDSYRALGRHYDQIRTRILSTILQTSPGGYRVNDARYLLGELHWRRDRFAEAKRVWSQMEADPQGLYADASASVLLAMREAEDHRRVNGILESEYQRWVEFYRNRLRRFGYALDAF